MAYLNESGLSYLWSKIKAYITNVANGKADANHGHSYNDLSDKPTIPAAYNHPSSHPASMITGLADVATSGSYEDLTNKPTIPATVAQLSDAGNYALKSELASVYKYKGTKATFAQLPSTGNTVGDVWDVTETGMNYGWTGTAWDALGMSITIDAITNAQIDAIIV